MEKQSPNKDEIKLYEIKRNILQYYGVNKFEEITKNMKKLKVSQY